MKIANLLVGNAPEAAGLEITLGQFSAEFTRLDRPDWRRLRRAAGRQAAVDRLALPGEKGQRLALGTPKRGMRSYRDPGGIAVPEMLGSCSTDMKAAFGATKAVI